MKNLILKTALLILINFTGFAQDKGKSQIGLSAGILTTEDVANEMLVRFADVFFPRQQHIRVDHVSVFGSYKYFVSEKIAVGGAIGYNHRAKPFNYESWNRHKNGIKVLTLAGEGTFYYLKERYVGLYALGGAGFFLATSADHNHDSFNKFGPAVQLTPFGVRFGKAFGGFAELGYGYKGLVNMGISVKL